MATLQFLRMNIIRVVKRPLSKSKTIALTSTVVQMKLSSINMRERAVYAYITLF